MYLYFYINILLKIHIFELHDVLNFIYVDVSNYIMCIKLYYEFNIIIIKLNHKFINFKYKFLY